MKVSEHSEFKTIIPQDIYMRSYNGLHSYEILAFWQSVTLEDPDAFQIMLMDEDDEIFTIYDARALHAWEYFVDPDTLCLNRRAVPAEPSFPD